MADETSKIPEPISLEELMLKRKKEQEELSRVAQLYDIDCSYVFSLNS